jgi:uncharacterized protein DUF6152
MRRVAFVACAILQWAVAPATASAHHGSAAHFDEGRRIEIVGVVRAFEARNPHSFLYIDVADERGETVAWRCEFNSIASTRRAGVDENSFTPGESIRVVGHPARRDAHECFFLRAELGDGRTVSLPSWTPQPTGLAPLVEQDGIFGTWVRKSLSDGGPRMLNFLTEAGRAAVAAYDPVRDDPVRRCSPVNPTRLWSNPVQPSEIVDEGDRIVMRFEFMDAVREVFLTSAAVHPADGPRTVLGHSIGRWEGDTLVIETENFSEGVVSQYADTGDGRFSGILHSDEYRLTERLTVNPQTGELEVRWTHEDPKYFTRAFSGGPTTLVRRPDLRVNDYDCEPDPE